MFELSLPLTNPHTDRLNPHVLYTFYSLQNKDTLLEYTPRYHAHDFLELSIMLEGSIDYKIEEKMCTVTEGDVLIFNPHIYHVELPTPTSTTVELHIGIENVLFGKSIYQLVCKENGLPILSLHNNKESFFNCCYELLQEQNNQSFGYKMLLKSLATKLLVLLCRELETTPNSFPILSYAVPNTEKNAVAESMLYYIHANYHEDISLDLMAKNMFLSSVYISKIFKELIGESPIQYVIKLRLEKAFEMLITQNKTIKEVALAVGYKDAYYFSKLFKKHYGFSPSHAIHHIDS